MKQFIILFSIFVVYTTNAQQLPQYTQWYQNQFSGNPAHAGIKRCIDVHVAYRNQWVGFNGSPKSGFVTASIPLYTQRKAYLTTRHGAGFKFEHDQVGAFSFNRFNIAYAAHFNFDKHKRISFGLYAGMIQMGYDPSLISVIDLDPAVFHEGSIVAPDASFGVLFKDERYFIGLAFNNLIPTKWSKVGLDSKTRLHIELKGGYQFVANKNVSIIPAFLLRTPVRGKTSVDINLFMDYKNTLMFGLGYRNTDALLAFASLKINGQFALVYSFDYTLSKIQNVAKNTHEISLRFSTCKIKKTRMASCPLF